MAFGVSALAFISDSFVAIDLSLKLLAPDNDLTNERLTARLASVTFTGDKSLRPHRRSAWHPLLEFPPFTEAGTSAA